MQDIMRLCDVEIGEQFFILDNNLNPLDDFMYQLTDMCDSSDNSLFCKELATGELVRIDGYLPVKTCTL